MSHNSSRNRARDSSRPLKHRASHVRSCLNHVANRLGVTRDELMEFILKETGVNLNAPGNVEDLMKAFEYMEAL